MKFSKDVMEASAKNGFTNATDAADYLVNHGVPFRDAHGIVGRLVLLPVLTGEFLWMSCPLKLIRRSALFLKKTFTKPSA